MYRYRYAKRMDGRDFKVDCPACGAKKTFKRFYDEKEMALLSEEYGICDRIDHCGYEKRPENETVETVPTPKEPKPINTLPLSLVERSLENTGLDCLSKFLKQHWGRQADIVLKDYLVASVKLKSVWQPLFWLISDKNAVHSGKIMSYKMQGGEPKRYKYGLKVSWIHSKFKDFNYQHMTYGSHLLSRYPLKKVAVVESEKTALIMACHSPQYVWLATGSLQSLQEEYLPDLKGRDVVLFPDKGDKAYSYWRKKLSEFKEKNLAKSIKISNFVSKQEILQDGDDIADYVIYNLEK